MSKTIGRCVHCGYEGILIHHNCQNINLDNLFKKQNDTEFVLNELLTKKEKQMTQANEELREKINEKFFEFRMLEYNFNNSAHRDGLIDEIVSLIPQPEQLEVWIRQDKFAGLYSVLYGHSCLFENYLEQPCLDFCKRFNLKVVNESDKDGLK